MNISTALKRTARIKKEISQQMALLIKNNRVREDETRISPLDILLRIKLLLAENANLKGRLAIASAPIVQKLAEMEGLRSLLHTLCSINTSQVPDVVAYGMNYKEVPVRVGLSVLTAEDEKKELQKKIDNLQDEVDEFNASTILPN